jgi:hypothetical protein
MDDCPSCTMDLLRHGNLHCPSGACPWIICGTCHATIDADTGNYWDGAHLIWGWPDGYLKATDA